MSRSVPAHVVARQIMTDEPPSLKPVADPIMGGSRMPCFAGERRLYRRQQTKRPPPARELAPETAGWRLRRRGGESALRTGARRSNPSVFLNQPTAELDGRNRFLTMEAFRAWLANTSTEIRSPDGKIRSVTHADRFITDPRRRSFKEVSFSQILTPSPAHPAI